MDTRTKLSQDPNTSQESKDQHSVPMSIECWRIYTNPYSVSSITRLCPTFWDPMDCTTLGFLAHHQLPELTQTHGIELVMPFNHLLLCHPLLLPSNFPSIKVFPNESGFCIRWPKCWSFSFRISPSNEYSGLISFTIDWFDLLAVQGNLKSCLQHHSSKTSILRCSAFFMVQLSHLYMTLGKAKLWLYGPLLTVP